MSILPPEQKPPLFDPDVDDGNAARKPLVIEIGGLRINGEQLINDLKVDLSALTPMGEFRLTVTAKNDDESKIVASAKGNAFHSHGVGAILPLDGFARLLEMNLEKIGEFTKSFLGEYARGMAAYVEGANENDDEQAAMKAAMQAMNDVITKAGGRIIPLDPNSNPFKQ